MATLVCCALHCKPAANGGLYLRRRAQANNAALPPLNDGAFADTIYLVRKVPRPLVGHVHRSTSG